jgi:hypothetical protein
MTENEFIRSNGWFIASPAYFGMNMNKQGYESFETVFETTE